MTHETTQIESGSLDARPPSLRWLAAIALLHLTLALIYTWPLVRDWHSAIPGSGSTEWGRPHGDSLQYLWNVWWFRRAIQMEQSPFVCPLMFHPQGAHLYFNTPTLPFAALAAPFVQPLGVVEAANVAIVLILMVGGCFGSLLGWEATRSRAGALVTGLSFAFAPFVFGRLAGGQWNYATAAPMALVAWLLLRLARAPGLWGAVAVGVGLAVAGSSDYTSLLFLLMLSAMMAGAALVHRGPAWQQPRRFLGALAGAGLVLCALMAPVLLGAYREYAAGGSETLVRAREPGYSADLADYLLPNPAQPMLRRLPHFDELHAFRKWTPLRPGPGFSVLVLAALGIASFRRRPKDSLLWWGLVGLGALVLSLGDTVRFFGWELMPLPYELLDGVPVLGYMRNPARYCMLVQLAAAVLAGYGAAGLATRPGRSGTRLVALAAAAIVFELLPAPIPMKSTAVPPIVQRLADAPGSGAVWEVALGTRESLLYQTVHGRPITDGYYSRIWARDRRPELLLLRLLNPTLRGAPRSEETLRDVVEAWNLRFILVAPSARRSIPETLSRLPWVRLLVREDNWHLFEIVPMESTQRAGLPARLVERLGLRAGAVEPALFLGLRLLAGEEPQVLWNETAAQQEAEREFWRRWLAARQ